MKKYLACVCFALLIAGSVLIAAPVSAVDCTEYFNSTQTYIAGYGFACAGSGGTCTECVDEGGNSCTYDGPGTCDPTPENQW